MRDDYEGVLEASERVPESRIDPREVWDLARSLSVQSDLDTFLRHIGSQMRELCGADLVLLFQSDPRSGDFLPSYSLGFDTGLLEQAGFAAEGPLARWLLASNECLVLAEDLRVLEHLDSWERELLGRVRAQVCIPLLSLKRLLGMAMVGSTDPGWRLSRRDLELLTLVFTEAALAIENAQLRAWRSNRLRRLHLADRLATVGQLAAGVAHEIRNPLTAIRSTIEYLLPGFPEGDPKRGLVQGVLEEVGRIHQTVESLLELTRTNEPRQVEHNLLETLDQALLLVEAQARQLGITIEKVYGRDLFPVMADPDQLKQVFLNLLLNSLQAMPGGGRLAVTVSMRSQPFSSDRSTVQVEIADTGTGLDEEQMERAFDPFFTTKPEGTGLGLPLSQSIIERHGGEIELRSRVGEGTAAYVRLPALG